MDLSEEEKPLPLPRGGMVPAFRSRHHLLPPIPLRIITNQSVVLRVNIFRRLSLKSTAGVSSGAADESPFFEYTKILQATSRSGFCKHRWICFYSCRCDKISQERHFKEERLILVQSSKVRSALVWECCWRELEAVGCAASTVRVVTIHASFSVLCCPGHKPSFTMALLISINFIKEIPS